MTHYKLSRMTCYQQGTHQTERWLAAQQDVISQPYPDTLPTPETGRILHFHCQYQQQHGCGADHMQEMTDYLWAPGKNMLAPLGLPPDLILCVKFVLQHQAKDHEAR